jgi:hypothetical protein
MPACCVLYTAEQYGAAIATFDEKLADRAADLGLSVTTPSPWDFARPGLARAVLFAGTRKNSGQPRRPARSAKASSAASTSGERHTRLRGPLDVSTRIPTSVSGLR